MTLILVFCAIAFFVFGYKVMEKTDLFLENNFLSINDSHADDNIDPKEFKQETVLIYGDNELTELVKSYCDSQNYLYEVITEFNEINTDRNYSCLLALSNNDAENLMISSVSLKIYSISNIITVYNSQKNLKLFKNFNFYKIMLYTKEADQLFDILKSSLQNLIHRENCPNLKK